MARIDIMKRISKSATRIVAAAVIACASVCQVAETYAAETATAATVLQDEDEDIIVEEKLSKKQRRQAAGEIAEGYTPWLKAGLDAKVKTDLLPVSVTLKASMECGENLRISVRAPFVGEAMRIEMDRQQLLIVNKMKKTYARIDVSERPEILEYAQSILLGRVVIVGRGELTQKNCDSAEFVSFLNAEGERTGLAIVPEMPDSSVKYAYSLDNEDRITAIVISVLKAQLFALMGNTDGAAAASGEEYLNLVEISVTYDRNGDADADINVDLGKRNFAATLECGAPVYGARPIDPIEIGKKYREVGLGEVLKF